MRTLRLLLLSTLAAFLTAACTVGPNFKRPDPPATAAYSQSMPASGSATSVAYGSDVAEDWYQLFHSETLNTLVHQALRNNPDLEAARHGLIAAQWEPAPESPANRTCPPAARIMKPAHRVRLRSNGVRAAK